MQEFALLVTACLFGGMTFFSFGFAPVLFKQLPMAQVRPLLRGTFPYYYLVIIAFSAVALASAVLINPLAAGLLAAILVSTLYARQILMPKINKATDDNNQTGFKRLHGLSVVIQLVQIGLCALAVIAIA